MNQSTETQAKLFIFTLKEIAEQKEMSFYRIAKITGLSETTIGRFFRLEINPKLPTFIAIAKALDVNFYFESSDSKTDLNKMFENAMEKLGRRPERLPKN